jgi:hypothetical protein
MLRGMRSCLLPVLALVLACDRSSDTAAKATKTDPAPAKSVADAKSKEEPNAKVDAKDVKPDAKPDAEKPAAPQEPATPKLTKEQRAEYRAHFDKGRTLSKGKQWAEAITSLEAALAIVPGDDRVMGELSWAAFSSGDHKKAREMGRAAALAATKPGVKAAALYNLGRAEEASGRLAEAKAAYAESIALRPNKTVSDRLAALEKSVPGVADPLPCATPQPEADMCTCLSKSVDDSEVQPACKVEPLPVDGLAVATYATSGLGEERVVVVARQAAAWSVVADLAWVYNPGMMGIHEELTLGKATTRKVGTHTIVEITANKSRGDSDMGIDEIETEASELLVVCVLGDATTPTTCPLDVITHHVYERDRMGMLEEGETIDESLRTPGLPIREETRITVEYADDGVAKLRAVAGKVDADKLGDRKLW